MNNIIINKTQTKLILDVLSKPEIDFGNKILYNMCSENPEHKDAECIKGKIWLIGRAYAASIERRKKEYVKHNNDDFYGNIVGPKLLKFQLDKKLNDLKGEIEITDKNKSKILLVHKMLCTEFQKLSGLEKRSLASKYLHFHFPELFYIYDKRANLAISLCKIKIPKVQNAYLHDLNVDIHYAQFFIKTMIFSSIISEQLNQKISPRFMDSILIQIANNEIKKRNIKE